MAGKNVMAYLTEARELAAAVAPLKERSVALANDAVRYQAKGLVVVAQHKMMEAHEVMNQAQQLEAQAKQLGGVATKINAGIGLYDLASAGASAYASHAANPGAAAESFSGGSLVPPLPAGITYQ